MTGPKWFKNGRIVSGAKKVQPIKSNLDKYFRVVKWKKYPKQSEHNKTLARRRKS